MSSVSVVSVFQKIQSVGQVVEVSEGVFSYLSQSRFIELNTKALMNLKLKISNKITQLEVESVHHKKEADNFDINIKEGETDYKFFKNEVNALLKKLMGRYEDPVYSKFVSVQDINKRRNKQIKYIDEYKETLFEGVGHYFSLYHYQTQVRVSQKLKEFNDTTQFLIFLSGLIDEIITLLTSPKIIVAGPPYSSGYNKEEYDNKTLEEKARVFYDRIRSDQFKSLFFEEFIEYEAQEIRRYANNRMKLYKKMMGQMKHLNKIKNINHFSVLLDYIFSIRRIRRDIKTEKDKETSTTKRMLEDIRKFQTGFLDEKTNTYKLKAPHTYYQKEEDRLLKLWDAVIFEKEYKKLTDTLNQYENEDAETFIKDMKKQPQEKKTGNLNRVASFHNLCVDTYETIKAIKKDLSQYIANKFVYLYKDDNIDIIDSHHFKFEGCDLFIYDNLGEQDEPIQVLDGGDEIEIEIKTYLQSLMNNNKIDYNELTDQIRTAIKEAVRKVKKEEEAEYQLKKQMKANKTINTVLKIKIPQVVDESETETDDESEIETDYDNTD